MFWQEETAKSQFQMPNQIIDLIFDIDCKTLPVDHAYDLSQALADALPWSRDDPRIGIHAIHVAGSQNGWERPEHGSGQRLVLSRRTKLTVRIPSDLAPQLQQALEGKTLDVGGFALSVGKSRPRPLSKQTTLFSRYVVVATHEDENTFLQWAVAELATNDIRVRKALCGKKTRLATPLGDLLTRSLMLADLSLEESVRLQQQGLGSHRHMGCGLFIPHKGIDAVHTQDNG
jgi:CRISPR-associated protein Cas6